MVVLIFSSLINGVSGHLFIQLFAIYTVSLVKCLFRNCLFKNLDHLIFLLMTLKVIKKIFFRHKSFIRYMILKYFHLVCGLSDHSPNSIFWRMCMSKYSVTSVISNSLWPLGLQPARLLYSWMGFSRQEYWCQLPCLLPGDLPNPGKKTMSPAGPSLKADSLPLSCQGSPSFGEESFIIWGKSNLFIFFLGGMWLLCNI